MLVVRRPNRMIGEQERESKAKQSPRPIEPGIGGGGCLQSFSHAISPGNLAGR
jgi:hypothetical protein